MNPRQRAFADALLAGMNQTDALRVAAPHLIATHTNTSLSRRAYDYANSQEVKAYVETELARREMKRREMDAAVLSRVAKRAFLGHVVRAHEEPKNKAVAHYRAHDPLQAIQIDNKMTGDDAPVKVEGEITLGVIMHSLKRTTGLPPDNEMADAEAIDVASVPTAALPPAAPGAVDESPAHSAESGSASKGRASNGENLGAGLPTIGEMTEHTNGNGHTNGKHRRKYRG